MAMFYQHYILKPKAGGHVSHTTVTTQKNFRHITSTNNRQNFKRYLQTVQVVLAHPRCRLRDDDVF